MVIPTVIMYPGTLESQPARVDPRDLLQWENIRVKDGSEDAELVIGNEVS